MEGIYICLRSIFCSVKGSPEAFWFRSFWNILALWPLDLNSRSCNLMHGWCMVSDGCCLPGGGAGRSKKYAKILAGCFWRYSTSPRGSFRAYGGVGMPRSLWDLTWWRGFVSVGLSCLYNLIYFGEKHGRVPGQQPEIVGKLREANYREDDGRCNPGHWTDWNGLHYWHCLSVSLPWPPSIAAWIHINISRYQTPGFVAHQMPVWHVSNCISPDAWICSDLSLDINMNNTSNE